MDDLTVMQVRDLHGEELDLLGRASPAACVRFLVEAGEVLAGSVDGDVLVIGTEDEVWAAAAAGYDGRFHDVRVVTARGPRDQASLRRLLDDIEERTVRRRCPALVSSVDVLDEVTRRTFERLGYVVTGAGVADWTERTAPGEPECAVDTWTMRKVAAVAGGIA